MPYYWRLSAFYFLYFGLLGTLVPYWSLYLKDLGFSATTIGLLMAVPHLTKVVAPNLWGWLADRSGARMRIIRLGNLAAALVQLLQDTKHEVPPFLLAEAQRREFFAQIHRWRRQGHEVLVLCNNEGEQKRLEEIWAEYGFAAESGPLDISHGALSRGFLFSEGKWAVVSDAEIFGNQGL